MTRHLIAAATLAATLSASAQTRTVTALPTNGAVVIDGKLDEPC
jgi:hypothetical protein